MARLHGLGSGGLTIVEPMGRCDFGDASGPRATVCIHRPRLFRRVLAGGTLGVAASYMDGDFECDDLVSFFRLFLRNDALAGNLDGVLSRLMGLKDRLLHVLRRNTRRGSQANIQAHYDLGDDFFRFWLDESLAYSSGIFPRDDATLHDASIEKFDRACRKLDLKAQDHLLEIGTGWGGLAMYAAAHYGCRVTTTTLSRCQFETATARVAAAGLADRVTVLLQDYRDLTGRYNKLVSIEMVEAIGHRYLDAYFRKCAELLTPDGMLLLQAIVMPERGYDKYLRSVDFIQRYIFPGGCLPSVGAMLESAGRASGLNFVHSENFAPHYAETLRRWRLAFHERLPEIRALGLAETFLRTWHYYLCYCEAAFEERHVGVVQMQFHGASCRRDPLEVSALAAAPRPCSANISDDPRPTLSPSLPGSTAANTRAAVGAGCKGPL